MQAWHTQATLRCLVNAAGPLVSGCRNHYAALGRARLQRAIAWEDDGGTHFRRGVFVPYQFDFDQANQIARGRFEGRITDEDLRNYYSDAEKYVALTKPRGGLLDFSAASSFEATPATIQHLAALTPVLANPSLPRVLVAPAPLIFGMLRMFEMLGDRTRPSLHVVRTEQEAWAILGVREPQFGPYRE